MISIVTPTHNSKYLGELFQSIKDQTFTDWEWVLLVNGDALKDKLDFLNDSRVKIHTFTETCDRVGKLKKTAFGKASGDILVEVDHDDLLTPDCLEELNQAFKDPEVGFVYSNNAKLSDDFIPYNSVYGWKRREFEWKGKKCQEMLSFEPSAASFSFIWYMPDHVRAWRKSVYNELGGHKEDLDVLDDQDLLIRTYLKTKVHFINKCLYLYRITGDNTWLKKNAKIQEKTVEIYYQYAYQVAERWADLNGLMKVDLGGGFDKPAGYTSIDLVGGDIIADLSKGIPLPDNSCGVVRAHDFLEHIADKQKIMFEIWRVLADGGWLMAWVPSTDGRGAFQDPTHVSYWNSNAFWYWTRDQQARYIRNDKIRFQVFRLDNVFPTQFHKDNNIPYTVAYLSAIKSSLNRPGKISF